MALDRVRQSWAPEHLRNKQAPKANPGAWSSLQSFPLACRRCLEAFLCLTAPICASMEATHTKTQWPSGVWWRTELPWLSKQTLSPKHKQQHPNGSGGLSLWFPHTMSELSPVCLTKILYISEGTNSKSTAYWSFGDWWDQKEDQKMGTTPPEDCTVHLISMHENVIIKLTILCNN